MRDTEARATFSGNIKLRLSPSTPSKTVPGSVNPPNSTRPPLAFNRPPSMLTLPPTNTKLLPSGTGKPLALKPAGSVRASATELF